MGKDIWCIRSYQKNGNENSTLAVIWHYCEKIIKGEMHPEFKRPSGVRGKKDDQVNFICGFYKIDDVMAKRLLEKYGSVIGVIENVVAWSDDIKGVGNSIQERAIELLFKRYKTE